MKTLLSEDQLEGRKFRIGSSDVATIMGAKQGLTELWEEKTGRKPRSFSGNSYTEWGNRLEDVVAKKYEDDLKACGLNVSVTPSGTIVHEMMEWAQATPDRIVTINEGQDGENWWGLEIKTTTQSEGWGPDGTDLIPEWVEWQVRWQMMVMGFNRWDVAVLINGSDYRRYTILRDGEKEDLMVEKVGEFWFVNVKEEVPPEEPRHLRWLNTDDPTDTIRQVSDVEADLVRRLVAAKQEKAKVEAEVDALEYEVKRSIGRDLGIAAGDTLVKWSPVKGRTTVNWKAVADTLRERIDWGEVQEVIRQNTSTGNAYRRLTLRGEA